MPSDLQASVVIPTHGRRDSLLRVLEALSRQSVPASAFEVIVICDGDVDGSVDACRALAPRLPYLLQVLEQQNQGPAAARNRGVGAAEAPLIVFIDDDVVPDQTLLEAHLDAQAGQELRVTLGPLLPPPDFQLSPWCAWEERGLIRQYDDMAAGRWQPTERQFYTGNASLLKQHIVAAGGFDVSFRRAEDVELAIRLGARGLHFVFLPEARGWHYVQRSYDSWLRMSSAYGEADVAMARAGHLEVLQLVAPFYKERHPLVRGVSQLCAGRPAAARAAVAVLGALINMAARTRSMAFGNLSCSLVFNLRYYDGVANALGGRAAFLALLRGAPAADLLRRSTPTVGYPDAPPLGVQGDHARR
jgi:GT2 family glycosyltransferase